MKNNRINVSIIFSLLLCGLLVLPAGCGKNDSRIDIPMDIDELTLMDMWSAIVTEAKEYIQEETTRLNTFYFDTDEKGKVRLIGMELWGLDLENVPTFYSISVLSNRELRIDSVEIDPAYLLKTYHPVVLFRQLDEIGLPALQEDTDGISIRVDFYYGGRKFEANNDVFHYYHLKDGALLPLEKLEFKDDPFIGGIKIGMTAINETHYTGVHYLFIDEDITHAEVIDYIFD